ncbi:flagellar hook-associated protein FlgK [Arthrobacter mobilis]|uniref:Flagellar hook-associated protein 1 n=1 Tax=Arthrobacter mobilis TaxID=2724944 RepID=A0A7X6K5B5_9MICC|nr:flagellar hook-associated protein FlgK [Arthrobacter mobilis]NKX53600.1 flagellar hook-associated protein FlgK [Arthrobacter mobilis]
MSTFSGLTTAYTGLVAARQGLNVVGQNIANVNTEGYTRQRTGTSAIGALARTGLVTGGVQIGQGVSVDAIARLGDLHLDARVRASAAAAGNAGVRAEAMAGLEASLREPGSNGISAQLQEFWAAWQDLSNRPDDPAAGAVVLEEARTLAGMIGRGYQEVANEWDRIRTDVDTMAAELNGAAAQVAGLNEKIRFAVANGGSANELIDQRNQLTTSIAALTGASVRELGDGQVEVLLGGNALVSGATAHSVMVGGAGRLADGDGVRLEWASRQGTPLVLDGGEIAGALAMLGSAAGDGPLRQAAAGYNAFAGTLAGAVNAVHRTGYAGSVTGTDFFGFAADPGIPPAQGLLVLPAEAGDIATAAGDAGALDGSIADTISQLGTGAGAPDRAWEKFVTGIGAAARTELRQSELAGLAADSALALQLSNASVDLDEENINLLSYQHAYQGAARVMTAVDEMLDTLINRTGLVGR